MIRVKRSSTSYTFNNAAYLLVDDASGNFAMTYHREFAEHLARTALTFQPERPLSPPKNGPHGCSGGQILEIDPIPGEPQ